MDEVNGPCANIDIDIEKLIMKETNASNKKKIQCIGEKDEKTMNRHFPKENKIERN